MVISIMCLLIGNAEIGRDSLNVRQVGRCDTPGYAWDVFVSGSYAYVADYFRGLRVIDVSNPQSPHEIGACDSATNAVHVMVADSLAYVAGHTSGIRIVDVRDPAHPALLSTFRLISGHGIYNVDVANTVAFAISSIPCPTDQTLRVIDISDPAAPVQIDSIPAGEGTGQHLGLRRYGNYLFLHSITAPEFRVFSIVDPDSVVQVGGCALPSYPSFEIQTSGTYAYATCNNRGLAVIDIANPIQPQVVGQATLPGYPWGVAISWPYAFVTAWAAGLRVVDIADPYHPVEIGFHDTPDHAQGVYYQAPYIYVACDTAGLVIYELLAMGQEETAPAGRITGVRLRSTIITDAIELLGAGTEEFRVYNSSGRRLGSSRKGFFDCRNLPDGVYFVTLKTGSSVKVVKIQ